MFTGSDVRRGRTHPRRCLRAWAASARVPAMSPNQALWASRPRSAPSAATMSSSRWVSRRSIAPSCRSRHATSRVRPVANVRRSRSTVAAASGRACATGPDVTTAMPVPAFPARSVLVPGVHCRSPSETRPNDQRAPDSMFPDSMFLDGSAEVAPPEIVTAGKASPAVRRAQSLMIMNAWSGHRRELTRARSPGRGTRPPRQPCPDGINHTQVAWGTTTAVPPPRMVTRRPAERHAGPRPRWPRPSR